MRKMQLDSEEKIRVHSVKFNVLMNMIVTTSQFVFPLLTVPYVSRVLSPRGTGAVAFAQSIASYFSLIAMLGISSYGVQVCASVRDDRKLLSQTVKELLVILTYSTTIVYIVYMVCLFTIPRLSSDKPLFFITSVSLLLSSFGVEWFYQAIEQYGYITIRNILFKILAIALMFLLIHKEADYRLYAFVSIVASVGSNVLNILRLRKLIDFSSTGPLRIKRHFKPIFSFTIISVFQGMSLQIDLILLGFLGTNSMVGLYQLDTKIKNIIYSAINSVSSVMLPRLSYYNGTNKTNQYHSLILKNFDFLTVVSAAAVCLCIILAEPIIYVLGGSGFRGSVLPLQIIAISLLFSGYSTLFTQHLIATHKEKQLSVVCVIMFFSMVLYCFVLIPPLGVTGTALAMTLCELTELTAFFFCSFDLLKLLSKHSELWKVMLSVIPAFIFSAIVAHYCLTFNVILRILLPTVVYGVIYGLMLLLTKEYFTQTFFCQMGQKARKLIK